MKRLLSTLFIVIISVSLSSSQQFWIKGIFTNTNSPVQVTITGYDSLQSPVTYTMVTDTNNSFIVSVSYNPNSFHVVSFTNCNGIVSDYLVTRGVFGLPDTVFIILDYCPATGGGGGMDTFRDVWVEGTFFNADTNLVPVTVTVVDSLMTSYNTVSNSSNYFGINVSARFSSAIIVSYQDCNNNTIDVQSGIAPIFGGDTVRFLLDYCAGNPNWPIDTSCDADFTVQQATDVNGSPIANQAIVYDNSTGSNLQYLWLFGSASFGAVIFDSVSLTTPTYTFNTAGPYYLCLFVFSDSGCFDYFCDTINVDSAGYIFKTGFTITVVHGEPTNIEELPSDKDPAVYPNPVSDLLIIDLQNQGSGLSSLEIYDSNGRFLSNKIHYKSSGENKLMLDVKGLANGTYFFRIKTPSRLVQGKFLKN